MSQPNPIETFLLEAEELLQQIEAIALDLLSKDADSDSINRLFRAMHTLKGSGSMFGFDDVAAFAHHLESALEKVREETLPLTPTLVELILSSTDRIKAMLQGASPGQTEADIVSQLEALQGAASPTSATSDEATVEDTATRESQPQSYLIRFKPHPGIAAHGLDPASLLDELRSLGPCEVLPSLDELPPLDQYVADQCYLSWEIRLQSACDLNAVKDVFVFVEGESEVQIEMDTPPVEKIPKGAEESRSKSTTPRDENRPTPSATESMRKSLAPQSLVRVPSEKLDRLVSLVGELVMNQSRLAQVSSSIDSADLDAPVEAIEQLIAELHDNVLSIRMTPIGETFSRFRRLTHDLSKELGKRIELQTEGEETELDKTVLDRLSEPLVHLIRNSIDHGIEDEDTRIAAGKPPVGRILLKAAHDGGRVLVALQDDGKGFDPDRIRQKAIEKGLVGADASLSQEDIFSLIFQPGFSTAKQVTNVSGRGVAWTLCDARSRPCEAACA